jgi:hypothetical protein
VVRTVATVWFEGLSGTDPSNIMYLSSGYQRIFPQEESGREEVAPSGTDVKTAWSCTFTHPHILMTLRLINLLLLVPPIHSATSISISFFKMECITTGIQCRFVHGYTKINILASAMKKY